MSEQSRLELHEKRTEWPLVVVALSCLGLYSIRVLLEPSAANRVATSTTSVTLCGGQ